MAFFGLKIKGFVEVHPGLPEGCHKTWRRAKTLSSGAEKRRQATRTMPSLCLLGPVSNLTQGCKADSELHQALEHQTKEPPQPGMC